MPGNTESIQQRLESIRQSYIDGLPDKIEEINSLWKQFKKNPAAPGVIETLHRLIHSLVGSGATFGLADITKIARDADTALKKILGNPTAFGAHNLEPVTQTLRKLSLTIGSLGSEVQAQQSREKTGTGDNLSIDTNPGITIYIGSADNKFSSEITLEIGQLGFAIRAFNKLGELDHATAGVIPAALIADINFFESISADSFSMINRDLAQKIPTIFVSDVDSFQQRLKAIRMGGEAFFVKPLKIDILTDTLDKLIRSTKAEAYRVLIIDDSETTAQYYSLCLQQAGMVTETLSEPKNIWDKLNEFNPEIILMDMYMPDSLGTELAKLIRQHESYFSLPIVFLSAETDLSKQLHAMSIGGDDFLTKPIDVNHLIAAVKIRTERYRDLHSLMVCDGLTSLLNHTRLKAQVDIELSRAAREHKPLLYAMIDIDHFKSVNDTYGHPTGDRVIKNLARLLINRLRKTDVIGRYGGEEFAVALPHTSQERGEKILNDLREQFGKMQQHDNSGRTFTLTFSCGFAIYPDYKDYISLNRAADEALYKAKKAGRNQTIGSINPDQK